MNKKNIFCYILYPGCIQNTEEHYEYVRERKNIEKSVALNLPVMTPASTPYTGQTHLERVEKKTSSDIQ